MAGAPDGLRRLIRAGGPVGIARFMAEALGHPEEGYYATRDPLGAAGDFITAPEISQMFGELLGLWCIATWQQMGAPAAINLAEMGPGRGSLMADALRAANMAPNFLSAARLHLVETSPTLRQRQAAILTGHEVAWHERFADVPDGPLLLIANEFFDALPIRQFVRVAGGWRERLVDHDGERFVFALSADLLPTDALPDGFAGAAEGEIAETSPAREAAMAEIAQRIVEYGGAALIVDYGHARTAPGDTLQAVRDHKYCDALDRPGSADLTSHVDFAALGRIAAGCGAAVHGPVEQGGLLRRLGIEIRAARLKAAADARQAADIDSALARLTAPDQMGSLFKAIAVTHPDLPAPAGFEET